MSTTWCVEGGGTASMLAVALDSRNRFTISGNGALVSVSA
jgi:hypothetical protein